MTAKPLMYFNTVPVYGAPQATEVLTEADVENLAFRLTGDHEIARAWMDRPNVTLRGQTPREAIQAGESQRVANIIRSF